jgi:hypothetical protein
MISYDLDWSALHVRIFSKACEFLFIEHNLNLSLIQQTDGGWSPAHRLYQLFLQKTWGVFAWRAGEKLSG